MDLPQCHANKKCPMLDLQVWVDHCQENQRAVIRHSFFQKLTMSPLVFHANGVYAWKPKLTTMSEEFRRRLLHMDSQHTNPEKDEVIEDFLQKMTDSGYNQGARKEVIISAVKKYYRQVLEDQTGGRSLYRSSEEMADSRKLTPRRKDKDVQATCH